MCFLFCLIQPERDNGPMGRSDRDWGRARDGDRDRDSGPDKTESDWRAPRSSAAEMDDGPRRGGDDSYGESELLRPHCCSLLSDIDSHSSLM